MNRVQVYTDGSSCVGAGPGGWGVVLTYGQYRKEILGSDPATTNNRMELKAVIEALKLVKDGYPISVYTDSQYVQRGITEWIITWKAQGWKRKKSKPIKNLDLWKELDSLTQARDVEFHWVRGHNGNELNEAADALARAGKQKVM